jgi:predicted peptidase
MVFLHGIGENGSGSATDLVLVNNHGPPLLISDGQWPSSRPFVVLSPQHAGTGCPSADEIHNFITFAIGHYAVDTKRVYLTGLSCGALGSASYFAAYGSQQVVASVLISGDVSPIWAAQGCTFVNGTALWAFHGSADPTVSITGDNTNMPKFIACPQPPRKDVEYTVYPGAGHDVWTETYDLSAGYQIYTWLLGFSF